MNIIHSLNICLLIRVNILCHLRDGILEPWLDYLSKNVSLEEIALRNKITRLVQEVSHSFEDNKVNIFMKKSFV